MAVEKKVAVVSGGGAGIGKAIALRLAREGMDVAVLDIRTDKANEVAAEIKKSGGNAIAIGTDCTKIESMQIAVDKIIEELGEINVYSHNVGSAKFVPFDDMTLENWHELTVNNIDSVFVCGQVIGNQMVKQAKDESGYNGYIIYSLSSLANSQDPLQVAYCASQWGARGAMRSIAEGFSKNNIKVNSIGIGTVWTESEEARADAICKYTGMSRANYEKKLLEDIPLGRFQMPDDVAGAVVYLVKEGVSIIGQNLFLGGIGNN